MFVALDINQNRVPIDAAVKGNAYFCPVCKAAVHVKEGPIKAKHFAHNKKCIDDWNYNDTSEWHFGWQSKYPVETREVVMNYDGQIHRADVCLGKYVIEFQHSSISQTEFNKRNRFYTKYGYKVLWLFDVTENKREEKIIDQGKRGIYNYREFGWKNAWKRIQDVIPQKSKDVVICLQLDDAPETIVQIIEALTGIEEGHADYRTFMAKDYEVDIITVNGLTDIFLNAEDYAEKLEKRKQKRKEEIKRWELYNEITKKQLYDPIERCLNKNGEFRIYPCFLSDTMASDDECGVCENSCVGGCIYRFKDIEPTAVEYVMRDDNGYITEIIFKTGEKKLFESVKRLGKTITELLEIYGPLNVARLRNIRTRQYVQLDKRRPRTLEENSIIFGKLNEDGRSYTPKECEINDANKPEWKMVWFVDCNNKESDRGVW